MYTEYHKQEVQGGEAVSKLLCVDHGGERWRLQLLPPPPPRGLTRGERRAYTAVAASLRNDRTSFFKLELLLYANFSPCDLFVTLTYDEAHLPPGWRESKRNAPAALRRLRESRAARGQPLRYVYVHESLHGDGRPHHHLICNAADGKDAWDAIWPGGYTDVETIAAAGGIAFVAQYVTKEPRDKGKPRPGERMWTPSRGLRRPEHYTLDVPDDYAITLPDGARPISPGLDTAVRLPHWGGGEYRRVDAIIPTKTEHLYSILT